VFPLLQRFRSCYCNMIDPGIAGLRDFRGVRLRYDTGSNPVPGILCSSCKLAYLRCRSCRDGTAYGTPKGDIKYERWPSDQSFAVAGACPARHEHLDSTVPGSLRGTPSGDQAVYLSPRAGMIDLQVAEIMLDLDGHL